MTVLHAAIPLSVLIVDDDLNMLRMVRALVERFGHQVEVARDGVDALRLFQAEPRALVLTDDAMPGMGGEALARAIKGLSPKTAIVLMSGRPARSHDSAVDAYLAKPFTISSLEAAIATALAACAVRHSTTDAVA